MSEILTNLSKVLPQLAILAAVFGFIGWSLRGLSAKPAAAKDSKPAAAPKNQGQERAKNLEASLEKSKAAHKALKSELDQLKASTVSTAELDAVKAELEAAGKSLEAEARRAAALETDLKKVQENNRNLNARATEADKAQKDRSFTLENELSKAREQLTLLQNRPDDSVDLNAEIERLRESVATSTRFAGELRKREAAAIESLEKAEARLAEALKSGGASVAPAARKIGPVGDSGRIAAAKAEVLRLVEQNKQRAADAQEISPQPAAASAPETDPAPEPVVLESTTLEPAPDVEDSAPEPTPESVQLEKKPASSDDLFANG
jgi:chromosome segregation ATPase